MKRRALLKALAAALPVAALAASTAVPAYGKIHGFVRLETLGMFSEEERAARKCESKFAEHIDLPASV